MFEWRRTSLEVVRVLLVVPGSTAIIPGQTYVVRPQYFPATPTARSEYGNKGTHDQCSTCASPGNCTKRRCRQRHNDLSGQSLTYATVRRQSGMPKWMAAGPLTVGIRSGHSSCATLALQHLGRYQVHTNSAASVERRLTAHPYHDHLHKGPKSVSRNRLCVEASSGWEERLQTACRCEQ